MPRPRTLKSHQYFDLRYPRVIYIVRDPRAVAISQYHFHRKRRLFADDYPIEAFVQRFIAGQTCDYGSWGVHVASWLSTRIGQPGFLLLRYEDILQDTSRELSKIVSFLDLKVTRESIEKAVERNSADNMRQLEKAQAHLFNGTKGTRQDIGFVRAANASGWKSALSEPLVGQIEAAWAPLMRSLGYQLTTSPIPGPLDELFAAKQSLGTI